MLLMETQPRTGWLDAGRVVHPSVTHSARKQSTFGWWIDGINLQSKTVGFFPTTNCSVLFDQKCQSPEWQILVDLAKSILIEENNNYDYYYD